MAGEAQAVGAFCAPLQPCWNDLYASWKRKYNHVKNLDNNILRLRQEKEYLSGKEDHMNVVIARNDLRMEMTSEAATWLQEVKEVKQAITDLNVRYQNVGKCLCGFYPFPTLQKLGEDTERKIEAVLDLMRRKENIIIVTEKKLARTESRNATRIDDVPSLYEHVEKLLECLNSDHIKKIGIWGLPGVGKTTIMENLNKKLKDNHKFDVVIWVTVTEEWSVSKIQRIIAERLRLNLEGINTDQQVATHISQALVEKNYLLLLDEVFSEINLHDVGIHANHEHGKLVLACRYKPIIDNMNLDHDFGVEKLSKADAQKLFREFVGDVFDRPFIKPIAELVVRECGGLPHVIKTIACTLRHVRSEDLWKDKLAKLRSSSKRKLEDMDDIFKTLELAYDDLREDQKNCFLYGALFSEDYEIYQDKLMECWNAERFIRDFQPLRRAREEGHAIMKVLMDRCLLERGRSSVEYVKMPHIIRRMALRVNCQQNEWLVGGSEWIEEHPTEENWTQKQRISLMCTNLRNCNLPEMPECHTLSTLFLQKNGSLSAIPDSFFDFMSCLNVLDLNGTKIKSLPRCISNLNNLRGLYLNDCRHLVGLPVEIVELRNLEVLDICGSGMSSLPIEIGRLSTLRCLRVSFTSCVGNQNHVLTHPREMIPSDIVKKLSLLEELSIDVDPHGLGWNRIVDVIAKEVASLKDLSSLCFYFPSVQCLEIFNNERKSRNNNTNSEEYDRFRSFEIKVGSHPTSHPHGQDITGSSARRHLRYSAGDGTPSAIVEVLRRTYAFELIGHKNVQKLSDFGIDEMKCLEVCIIEECNEMETILDANMLAVNTVAFQYLEKLHIFKLQKLNRIWEGTMGSPSVGNLTTLTLNGCPKIEKVLLWDMTQQLPKLRHLKVENCSRLDEIIEQPGQMLPPSSFSNALPKLEILELINLPRLVSICQNDSLVWPSLRKLEIKECQILQNLSLSQTNAQQLRFIECSRGWWGGLTCIEVKQYLEVKDRCRFV